MEEENTPDFYSTTLIINYLNYGTKLSSLNQSALL